jgi:hypothetical protein
MSLLLATLLLFGCTTTDKAEVEGLSGFLGDYSDLKPGTGDQAAFVYFNPDADFSKFKKVHIAPVRLWQADSDSSIAKMSAEDQQMLVDYLYASLEEKLSSDYRLVDQAGPGVLVVRAAITEAHKSKPVLNVASKITPIGLGVSYGKKLTTGNYAAVGTVGIEAELVEGGTGERLAAAVDRRAGGNSMDGTFDTWDDVKDAFDYWSRRLQTRLAELSHGS